MRIPIDYYRILGVLPQATDDQLSQAYEDRRMQLPRREYSDEAIMARNRLLEEAYRVLSEPVKRLEYDEKYHFRLPIVSELTDSLAADDVPDEVAVASPTSEIEQEASVTPEIERGPAEIIGVLLILEELGHYEEVIEWGEKALLAGEKAPEWGDDIHLCVALAYLELSREQWQQSCYEKAHQLGEKAIAKISDIVKFSKAKQEINKELELLQPYRILELLDQPNINHPSRKQGLRLLKNLLAQHQGMETGDRDSSGLNQSNFWAFIHQVRSHITLSEQIELFSTEDQLCSDATKYLTVQSLMAQGVSNKDPHAIIEASELLATLNKPEDTWLEKAICALLLGQTQIANQALQHSQDKESLAFINKQSQDSPDLLPGLYVFSKKWLETEVFPRFQDLVNQPASLTEYFTDDKVVSYLDHYLAEEIDPLFDPLINTEEPVGVAMASALRHNYPSHPPVRSKRSRNVQNPRHSASPRQAPNPVTPEAVGTAFSEISYPSQPMTPPADLRVKKDAKSAQNPHKLVKTAKAGDPNAPVRRKKKVRRQRKLKIKPLLFLLGTVGGLGALTVGGIKWLQSATSPLTQLAPDTVLVQLNQPPIEIPAENARLVLPFDTLTPESAKEVIETWLNTKVQAFGKDHKITEISKILTEPLAKIWESRAQLVQKAQSHWEYQHQVEIKSLKSETDSKQAVVDAQVKEIAKLYEKGQLNRGRSYEETLNVRYTLNQQSDQWMISAIEVLP